MGQFNFSCHFGISDFDEDWNCYQSHTAHSAQTVHCLRYSLGLHQLSDSDTSTSDTRGGGGGDTRGDSGDSGVWEHLRISCRLSLTLTQAVIAVGGEMTKY